MLPRVSVIIAAYNARDYIEVAVASALVQTEKNIEVLVADDGSTDGTGEIVRRIQDRRVRLLPSPENRGQSNARNRALLEALGEWIAFLDADDWYAPQRLETLLRIGEEHQADIVADDLYRTTSPEDPSPRSKLGKLGLSFPERLDVAGFLRLDSGLAPVIRRNFLMRHGLRFDESLRFGEDTLLLLECFLAQGKLVVWPQPLYYYREREGSLTTYRVETLIQRRRTIQELLQREVVQRDEAARTLLEERLTAAKLGLQYYQVIEPLRRGRLKDAVQAGLCTPSFLSLALKALPKILENRVVRRVSPHT